MGNGTSKVARLRKKRSRKKQLNDSGNFDDSSYLTKSSKSSFSEDTSSDNTEVLYDDLSLDNYYNTTFPKLWEMEYSASVDDVLTTMGRVLDVGCGNGTWLINMSRLYPVPEYTGVDPNPIVNVEYPPSVKVIKSDILSLPFEENQFDFIRMSNFSCNLTDNELVQAISEMIRVTKCGGWIEFWEIDALIPKNAPTFLEFLESFNGFLASSGVTGVSPTKLEYFLYNTRKLDNIQCSVKHVTAGQKGGENGTDLARALTYFFLDIRGEGLSNYMGISREEYRRKWTIVTEEIENTRAEMIYYKLWAQKKVNPEVD